MSSTLIVGRSVYAPGIVGAQAVLFEEEQIVWVGDKFTAQTFKVEVDNYVEHPDAFIGPGFVDAHIHLSATGLRLLGADLSAATSWSDLALRTAKYLSASNSNRNFLFGWDESGWPDDFSQFLDALPQALRVKSFYLARIDGHSAVVNQMEDSSGPKVLSGQVRQKYWEEYSSGFDSDFYTQSITAALKKAASFGVVSVHENAGPTVSSKADFLSVLSVAKSNDLPGVVPYWASADIDEALALGAFGVAGDFSVDGSLGSRTALLTESYSDQPDTRGFAQLSVPEIAAQIVRATRRGVQAGFHAIGDLACEKVHEGFLQALTEVTPAQVRACRHRIEHLSMPTCEALELFAGLGVVASVQPSFDAYWGTKAGMYESRLGSARLAQTHPFHKMIEAGMALAFGSDSPVTQSSPWDWIRAATTHNQTESQISDRAAFNAATRGGHRAARNDAAGVIQVGHRADLAIWQVENYNSGQAATVTQSWSTDPRSGLPALPDLSEGNPECLLTVRAGRVIYDRATHV